MWTENFFWYFWITFCSSTDEILGANNKFEAGLYIL